MTLLESITPFDNGLVSQIVEIESLSEATSLLSLSIVVCSMIARDIHYDHLPDFSNTLCVSMFSS